MISAWTVLTRAARRQQFFKNPLGALGDKLSSSTAICAEKQL